jgi:hypothetical protein
LRSLGEGEAFLFEACRQILPRQLPPPIAHLAMQSPYRRRAGGIRCGQRRNPPAEFQNMSLSQSDLAALVAFLESLTEDYDDA